MATCCVNLCCTYWMVLMHGRSAQVSFWTPEIPYQNPNLLLPNPMKVLDDNETFLISNQTL